MNDNYSRRRLLKAFGWLAGSLAVSAPMLTGCPGRPAPPPAPRVRRNVNSLQPNDPILTAYATAVERMRALPANHPHSWLFQASIHGTPAPNPDPTWNQCEHGTWWFFPWHRLYLLHFENIVRQYSGNPAFALPYWDYSDPNHRALPAAFREGTPLGELFYADRDPDVNDGLSALEDWAVDTQSAMAETIFATEDHATVSFSDVIEGTPHAVVHGFIGGHMGDVSMAGRDPIFWLHHANIDRLWVQWLAQGNRAMPDVAEWLGRQYTFYRESNGVGNPATIIRAVGEVMNTRNLGYVYQGLEAAQVESGILNDAHKAAGSLPAASKATRADVSASSEVQVRLDEDPLTIKLLLTAEGAAAFNDALDRNLGKPKADRGRFQVQLRLEDVRFSDAPDSVILAFLNLPEGVSSPDPKKHAQHFAGSFAFFGAAKGAHHGAGLNRTINVTDVVDRLRQGGLWTDDQVSVTLVRSSPGTRKRAFTTDLTVERVALAFTNP